MGKVLSARECGYRKRINIATVLGLRKVGVRIGAKFRPVPSELGQITTGVMLVSMGAMIRSAVRVSALGDGQYYPELRAMPHGAVHPYVPAHPFDHGLDGP